MNNRARPRSARQVACLASSPDDGRGRPRRPILPSGPQRGVRDDLTWVRPGVERARPDMGNPELVDSLEWMHVRAGREMGDTERLTLLELGARAWGWHEVSHLSQYPDPTWLDALLPGRRSHGYRTFIQVLLAAYRRGAVGVWFGYHECQALTRCSRDTWNRWVREWTEHGLVSVVQVWRPDPTFQEGKQNRARCHDKLLYRIGPALEQFAGPGLVEGVAPEGPRAEWARRAAGVARARARKARDKRCAALWAQLRKDPRFMRDPAGGDRTLNTRQGPIIGEQFPPPSSGGEEPALDEGRDERTKALAPLVPVSATPPTTESAPSDSSEPPKVPPMQPARVTDADPRTVPLGGRAPLERFAERLRAAVGLPPDAPPDPPDEPDKIAALLDQAGRRGLPLGRGIPPTAASRTANCTGCRGVGLIGGPGGIPCPLCRPARPRGSSR